MSKDPSERYQTASRFLAELEAISLKPGELVEDPGPVETEPLSPEPTPVEEPVAPSIISGSAPVDALVTMVDPEPPPQSVLMESGDRVEQRPRGRRGLTVAGIAVVLAVGALLVPRLLADEPAAAPESTIDVGDEATPTGEQADSPTTETTANGAPQVGGVAIELTGLTPPDNDEVLTAVQLNDGRVASGGADAVVRIWDPADPGTTIATYRGHTDWVFSVSSSMTEPSPLRASTAP